MEGIAEDGGELDPTNISREARIRAAYMDWCKDSKKEVDEKRFVVFSSNFLAMEEFAKQSGKEMVLNQYADCTEEEYVALTTKKEEKEEPVAETPKAKVIEEKVPEPEPEKVTEEAVAVVEEPATVEPEKEKPVAKKPKKAAAPKIKGPDLSNIMPSFSISEEELSEKQKAAEEAFAAKQKAIAEAKEAKAKEAAEAAAVAEKERKSRQQAQDKAAAKLSADFEAEAIAKVQICSFSVFILIKLRNFQSHNFYFVYSLSKG